MIAPEHLPIEAYLQMSFEPDCDYVDGRVVTRSVGGLKHSRTQSEFMGLVCDRARSLEVRPSLRMRTVLNRYRVADVAVFSQDPNEEYPEDPPLVVLEVVAPDDDLAQITTKLKDYRAWGVPHVWLADPYSERLHVMGADGLQEVPTFALAEYDLRITKEEFF